MFALLAILGGARPSGGDASPYVPGPGDVLDIEVYASGQRQETFNATVSPTGTIACPLIGDFALQGEPLSEVARRMGEVYENGYYVRPQVLINVGQYAGRVSVVGEVRHPGLYPLGSGLTLLGVIELAGGPTDFASTGHVRVLRTDRGKPRRLEADLTRIRRGKTPDMPLRRDDRVEVPQRWF